MTGPAMTQECIEVCEEADFYVEGMSLMGMRHCLMLHFNRLEKVKPPSCSIASVLLLFGALYYAKCPSYVVLYMQSVLLTSCSSA